MSAANALPTLARSFARGLVPTLIFAACIAAAFLSETLSFIAVFGGLTAYAVLTASTIAQARHPLAAVTAATLAAGFVTLSIVAVAWATLPIFWCVLAGACGVHVALRLLERRGAVFQVAGAVAGLTGGLIVGILSPLRHTTVVGLLCLAALAGLAAFRLIRGQPVQSE